VLDEKPSKDARIEGCQLGASYMGEQRDVDAKKIDPRKRKREKKRKGKVLRK